MEVRIAAGRAALPSALVCAMLLTAVPCGAQEMEPVVSAEARTRYARGVALYDQGSYVQALAELERANEIAPSFKLLYNIGLVHVQLGDFAAALRVLDAYLAAGAERVPAERRAEVEQRIAELRKRVATLDVSVSATGAEVTLDDAVVGLAPLGAPLTVNPGRHQVAARKAGYATDMLSVTVRSLDRMAVTLHPILVAPAPHALDGAAYPAASAHADERVGPPAAAARARRSPFVAGGWLTTGALAGGAVLTGILALSASSDLDARRAGTASSGAELDGLASRARNFALVSDICLAGAVVAGGIALYATLWRGEPARATSRPGGLRVGLSRIDVALEF